MTDLTPSETTSLDRSGSPAMDWGHARALMAQGPTPDVTYFPGTCRPDGTPHAAGLGAQWMDGDLYFTSNPIARKARDLAVNPQCTMSVRLPGIDLERVAAGYRAAGWPAEVRGDAFTAPFNAPSAGPPPYQVFRFTFHKAVGLAT